ncbi:hypothetical protein TBR22_A17950 [Luteitalea sp. TBR-22]|uniref:bifunctional aminoglycoside phosphotransferase/ATP-binding protein n=1 Tax=Luteitalea sp. TBR-22 TaxID=2802971 RepID=UPI001AFB9B49|nr:bifunctional aminoglycoside phosphotransferase/ATP-binding protein [Luteitalea sp. TBR-22]BCS32581.1 hypothetical protein TBR22_A17950 [Luteitalea sp. TBR-22]
MMTEDQSEVIAYLSQPSTHGSETVERLETHASMVFLVGRHALKLKRAVKYDYLDYSSCEKRHRMCEAELRLNRRAAPALYERLVPITQEADGQLALAGRGPVADWLVSMQRFDQEALFDRLATRQALPLELMAPLGEAIGRLHQRAAPRPDHGGVDGMARVITGNARAFQRAEDVLDPVTTRRLIGAQQALLARHEARLEARREQGLVRYCHGDLHLRNIVLLDGTPTLFDAIEFNEDLACIDVLYDLAFLLMDLWRLGLRDHANAVWNAYLWLTTDFGGMPLLPLFLSCRAAIRAKTSLATADLATDTAQRDAARALARRYLALAEAFLAPAAPLVLAIGGVPGTGKSTVARAAASSLGAPPGAVVVRSDALRKWLHGVTPTTRLGPEGYTPEETRHVYGALSERCQVVAGTGYAVVADAVLGRPEGRAAVQAAATTCGVPFRGVWLEAPLEVLTARVVARTGDASDADAHEVERQRRAVTPPADWPRIDASQPVERVLADVLAHAGACEEMTQ